MKIYKKSGISRSLRVRLFVFFVAITKCTVSMAGGSDQAIAKGVAWLVANQNVSDGSWGSEDLAYINTSEAVVALAELNKVGPSYYAGISWLYNHKPNNIDFVARRVLALGASGQIADLDLSAIRGAQALRRPVSGGWGAGFFDQATPLDTSLALQALNQQAITTDIDRAISYLTSEQSGSGWRLGAEVVMDNVSTAHAILALIPGAKNSGDLQAVVTTNLAALNLSVTSTSSIPELALATIANFRNRTDSVPGETYLNQLISRQNVDGGWGGVYETALALRALAVASGRDLLTQKSTVSVVDTNLRAAINAALGKSALDKITNGEISALTALDISNKNISSLAGLESAVNLVSLNASGNVIASTTPIAALKYLTQVNLAGNPLSLSTSSTQLTTSKNPATKNVPLNLTATVSGVQPIGSVTFYDGVTAIGSVVLNATSPTVGANSSVFVLNTNLSGGFRRISAVYSGDAKNTASSSLVITAIVNPDAAAIMSVITNTLVAD